MKLELMHEQLGKIEYEESFWTGKRSVVLDGRQLEKIKSKEFLDEDGTLYKRKGNYVTGVVLETPYESIRLSPTVKWYEIALSILPFILIMVWGNSEAACRVVPVVGGAIGGGISGALSYLNFVVIKGIKKIWLKILVSVGVLALTFLICYLIGLAIISAAS